jgi:guanine deaminase
VQHNPWSNLMLGSGVAPVRELLDAGVDVSLGSDGSCSTLTTSMLNVVGCAAAVSKLRGDEPGRWLSAREALHAGTLAGGRALGFGDALGSLRVGALADVVAYRLDSVTFTPRNDPLRQLVYAERGADQGRHHCQEMSRRWSGPFALIRARSHRCGASSARDRELWNQCCG